MNQHAVLPLLLVASLSVPGHAADTSSCTEPTRYRLSARHSPMTCSVATSLRKILERGPDRDGHVVMKVGDSITANLDFLGCFATGPVDLARGSSSLRPALDHFLAGRVDGEPAFARKSLASKGGETAKWAITGSPSPLAQELAASRARYAIVMFGTNDLWFGGSAKHLDRKYRWYAKNLVTLVDQLRAAGVVPVLSTIPPHNGSPPWFHDLVPTLNAIVWGIGQREQVPVVDYHEALLSLPKQGLGGDGIHPSRLAHGKACVFDEAGLRHGYNVRNLLSLEALDRVWRVTREREPAPHLDDKGAPPLAGSGTLTAPHVVDGLPFADPRLLPPSTAKEARRDGACAGERGAGQLVYRLEVTKETRVRALAIPLRGEAPLHVQLFAPPPAARPCVKSHETLLEARLTPGTWTLTIDAGTAKERQDVLFVITPCDDDDERCQ